MELAAFRNFFVIGICRTILKKISLKPLQKKNQKAISCPTESTCSDSELCDNYRSISLLSSLSKIPEKMIAIQLSNNFFRAN
jgi:hypothetical protein